VAGSYVLQDKDRVTMTPIKIDGAFTVLFDDPDMDNLTVCHLKVTRAEFVVHTRPAA